MYIVKVNSILLLPNMLIKYRRTNKITSPNHNILDDDVNSFSNMFSIYILVIYQLV